MDNNIIILPIINTEQKILNQIADVQSKLAYYLIKGNDYSIEFNEKKLINLKKQLIEIKKYKNETTNTN